MTRDQAIALAQSVIDQRPRSYVEAAKALAAFVLCENGYTMMRIAPAPPPQDGQRPPG